LPRRKKNLISFAAGLQKLSGFIDKGAIDHAD
jgi:hypothetical protein